MTELVQMIAEVEGIRTPKRKRSAAEREKIVADHNAKKATKKRAKPAKKTPAPVKAVNVDAKPKTVVMANDIPLNFISDTGYVREAGYDPKTKFFYIGFAKSTWAMPSNQKEWNDFEKAVADPNVNIDAYYRRVFKGRTGEMIQVRRKEVRA